MAQCGGCGRGCRGIETASRQAESSCRIEAEATERTVRRIIPPRAARCVQPRPVLLHDDARHCAMTQGWESSSSDRVHTIEEEGTLTKRGRPVRFMSEARARSAAVTAFPRAYVFERLL